MSVVSLCSDMSTDTTDHGSVSCGVGIAPSGTDAADHSRDVAMATEFVQKRDKIAYPLHLSLWHSETVWDIAT